jgi:hypothetical protein
MLRPFETSVTHPIDVNKPAQYIRKNFDNHVAAISFHPFLHVSGSRPRETKWIDSRTNSEYEPPKIP